VLRLEPNNADALTIRGDCYLALADYGAAASDGVVLATAVDGVILVVRAKRDSRGVARRACTLLADVNAHVFGAVLNAAQITRGGYFREQLRAYYDYRPDDDASASAQPLATKKT
jgi:Mrp family chromosome partitioning ATPase